MAEASAPIASFWPKTSILRFFSRSRSLSLSLVEIVLGGMRAILATMSSISSAPINFLRLDMGNKR